MAESNCKEKRLYQQALERLLINVIASEAKQSNETASAFGLAVTEGKSHCERSEAISKNVDNKGIAVHLSVLTKTNRSFSTAS
ncbi:MAG: hypothetical protein IEMM0003_0733 [bacterium]|nr:MAG: hypothetical protein IEMM0003_0733 [bacterium]